MAQRARVGNRWLYSTEWGYKWLQEFQTLSILNALGFFLKEINPPNDEIWFRAYHSRF